MKTFYAAVLLFLLLLAVIVGNTVMLRGLCDQMEQDLRSITELTALERTTAYWESKRWQAGLSINSELLFLLSEHMTEMKVALTVGDVSALESARGRALETIKRIRETAWPTRESLF